MADDMTVSASDWIKGISLSIAASIIGGASKLAIRKSYLMEQVTSTSTGSDAIDNVSEGESDGSASSLAGFLLVETGLEDADTESMGSYSSSARLHESTATRSLAGSYQQQVPSAPKSSLPLALRLSGMFGMTFLNPLCCVLAMNYASPSILAPFSGLTLVWIVVFSHPVIGEQPSARQVFAAALIVTGEVVVAVWGDHTNDEGVTVESVVSHLWWLCSKMFRLSPHLFFCSTLRSENPM